MPKSKRCACGSIIDVGEGWPTGIGNNEQCQDCWEKDCDASWWDAVSAFQRVQDYERAHSV